jgi:hypothetical protein
VFDISLRAKAIINTVFHPMRNIGNNIWWRDQSGTDLSIGSIYGGMLMVETLSVQFFCFPD